MHIFEPGVRISSAKVNENFAEVAAQNGGEPSHFAQNDATTVGLIWGYTAGVTRSGGAPVPVAAGTVNLTPNATNRVELDAATGAVAASTAATWNAAKIPLRLIETNDFAIVSSIDERAYFVAGGGGGTVADAAQAANTFKAGPSSGGAAAPTYRAIGAADLPSATTTTKGAVMLAAAGAATAGRAMAADDPRGNDARTPLAHVQTASTISDLTEAVQDIVGAFFQAGAGINVAYDDAANTFTITNSAPLSAEAVQDVVGAMAVSGSGATASYDDAAGTLTISATGNGSVSSEDVQDIVAALLTAGTNVGISYDDTAGTLTITASGGTAGANGWTPTLAIEADGARRVFKLTGWTGGTGAVPASGLYLGATGYVAAIADAADVRGVAGTNGSGINAEQIRGVGVAATAPTNGQALVFNGTNWAPGNVATPGGGNFDTRDAWLFN